MSNCYFAYSLPFLHKELAEIGSDFSPESVKYVWPGLAHMPPNSYWSAPDYPFEPSMAEQYLKSLEGMGEAALAGVPIRSLILMDLNQKKHEHSQELDDLRAFAQDGFVPQRQKKVEKDLTLNTAQKTLLWAFLVEKRVLEMRSLANVYREKITDMMSPLGVDNDSSTKNLINIEYQLGDGQEPLPPWKIILENASVFLPEHSIIFVACKQMMSDLQEILEFKPCMDTSLNFCDENLLHKYDAVHSKALIWQALEKKNNHEKCFWLDKSFTFIFLRGFNEPMSS